VFITISNDNNKQDINVLNKMRVYNISNLVEIRIPPKKFLRNPNLNEITT
jgi:hypothetical protein